MDNNTLKWLVAGVAVYLLFIKKKETQPSGPTTPVVDDIPGCTDPTADNYSDVATIDDGSCVSEVGPLVVTGCTDPSATNYDPLATSDDGSCILPVTEVMGCTDIAANNYNTLATTDDGSCLYNNPLPIPAGCNDSAATNYVPLSDGSIPCIYPVIGCQDTLAVNYNPNATQGCS
jgi:hypothetical protein